MKRSRFSPAAVWSRVGTRWLPFADAASTELPLSRLLRLSMFQISVGMVLVLTNGTLNRVMIVELGVPASLVALMISLPILFAPMRALIGHRSDHYKSYLGWRRVPFIWVGSILQFGGLAIMPFALLVLTGQGHGPAWIGQVGAAFAFIMVGAGTHTTQTAGLALATDIAPRESRPRVVALLYVMLLAGMVGSSLLLGWLLADFSPMRLVQVVQGAAMVAIALNLIALWKQEALDPQRTRHDVATPRFGEVWRQFVGQPNARRMLIAVALGSAAFSMQDILLEPFGGQVLNMSVGETTGLTALMAGGTLIALGFAARLLNRQVEPARVAALGALIGIFAFALVVCGGAFDMTALFEAGTLLIGCGTGLFSVGLLTEAMRYADASGSGMALGAWGAVQASATGVAIALGGGLRDAVATIGATGVLGPALMSEQAAYSVVYHLEIALLFGALIAMAPLVSYQRVFPGSASSNSAHAPIPSRPLGLADFPN